MSPEQFVQRWEKSAGAEMANSQLFLAELCQLLDVPQPDPTRADESLNRYVFEKSVLFNNGDGTYSAGRIDLYRQDCFVFESKQGVERKDLEQTEALAAVTRAKRFRSGTATRGTSGWNVAMQRARQQAKNYAEALTEWPPFLIVADVGYCFDLYADFTQTGKNYAPFPDPKSYRIYLRDLLDSRHRETLRAIWLDPLSLDPSRRTAKVTREIAEKLAKLAKSLEGTHRPEVVAGFLMRCLFTMFSEDVGLLPSNGFKELLLSLRFDLKNFVPMVESLWGSMDKGDFSPILRQKLRHFNGGFFKDHTALPLSADQLALLIEAAEADWTAVEPAIFGTLLERALDPAERHKLGAHFTPRAYVERLVMPTIIEPLREEWEAVYAAAVQLDDEQNRSEAQRLIRDFHGHLCEIRILDPACGSGNFLYVALELLKRLEGEVLNALKQFGDTHLPGLGVDPQQFLGIEVNPRAAAIAELVLWIGFLQWHYRTRENVEPPQPILKNYNNIECRDAVLQWDAIEPVVDADGNPVTRWDGKTTRPHPVTGQEVPDETARVQEVRYINPRKAEWPQADYIVGNPPFLGTSRMRDALGDGYTKAIRATYKELPESCDFVMYWWHIAAEKVRSGEAKRFGLITTNSIRQTFNRRVITPHLQAKDPLSIIFAIPDHPWVDAAMCAAVRIAMTVGAAGETEGVLSIVESEKDQGDEAATIDFRTMTGNVQADLRIGADVGSVSTLQANLRISCPGVKLHGAGFLVTPDEARVLGLGRIAGLEKHIRLYRNGKDITQRSRNLMVIDLYGLTEAEVQRYFPEVFQWVVDRVKTERENKVGGTKDSISYAEKWWLFGKTRNTFRPALESVQRYIATTETAKYRFFVMLDGSILPDNMLIAIAVDEAWILGVLSSRIHVSWALATGGRLGIGNDPRYNKTRCFETFPFPDTDEATKQRIGDLAEQLDAHRKRQQELHPTLTMTGMYNVLEKLRSGEPLSAKEKTIHEQGLVSVLKQLHDELDAAVFDAYGWPHDLSDEAILERLVALNHQRAAEEQRGLIRWLRPEFQNPEAVKQTELHLVTDPDEPLATGTGKAKTKAKAKPKSTSTTAAKVAKQPWPKTLPERAGRVREVLATLAGPATPEAIARHFVRAPKAAVAELLDTLVAVGQARQLDDGRYTAARAA